MPCNLVTNTGTILTCIKVCYIFFGRDYKNVYSARSFLHGYSFLAVEIVLRPIIFVCRYACPYIPFQSVAQIIIIIVSILIIHTSCCCYLFVYHRRYILGYILTYAKKRKNMFSSTD